MPIVLYTNTYMTEISDGLARDIPSIPTAIQDRFLRFSKIIGSEEDVVIDKESLRMTRRPKFIHTTPKTDDLSEVIDYPQAKGHAETVEYFYFIQNPKPGRDEFEHSAEVSFNVTDARAQIETLLLQNPQGDEFGFTISSEPFANQKRKTVEIKGKKASAGVSFTIIYDFNRGTLQGARLETLDGKNKTKRFFVQPNPYESVNQRDTEIGKSLFLPVGTDNIFLLRIPTLQDFGKLLSGVFPEKVFKNPSETRKESDTSWRFVDWPQALNIRLTQNGKQTPLQF